MRWIACLFAAGGLAACSTAATPPTDTGPTDTQTLADQTNPGIDAGADTGVDAVAPPIDALADLPAVDAVAHPFALSFPTMMLNPGQETTMCVLQRLGNDVPLQLRRISAHLGDTSHHLIFYRSNQTMEQRTPFRCSGFSGVTGILNGGSIESPLLIAQMRDAALQMPDGVGMNLDANQMVRIEMHVINTTAAPVMATGNVTLETVERTGALVPADVMFWGSTRINVAAHSTGQVHYYHRAMSGTRIFGLTSHTHHYGVLSTISLATNATTDSSMASDIRELHRSTNWSDPPLTTFGDGLDITTGQGLHLVCNYNNTSANAVTFGESFNDEMCFLWAYYYPAPRGTQICAETDQFAGNICIPSG